MGATDPAGAALQAPFIVDADPVLFQTVDIGRANVKAGLPAAVVEAHRTVQDLEVRSLIHFKAVEKQFVFYGRAHQRLL